MRLYPNWANGDYYGKAEPLAGMTQAMRQVTLDALSFAWADEESDTAATPFSLGSR